MGKRRLLTDPKQPQQPERWPRTIFIDQPKPDLDLNRVRRRRRIPPRPRLRPYHDVCSLRMLDDQIHYVVTTSLKPTRPFPRSTQNLTVDPTATASIPVATCP